MKRILHLIISSSNVEGSAAEAVACKLEKYRRSLTFSESSLYALSESGLDDMRRLSNISVMLFLQGPMLSQGTAPSDATHRSHLELDVRGDRRIAWGSSLPYLLIAWGVKPPFSPGRMVADRDFTPSRCSTIAPWVWSARRIARSRGCR